MTGTDMMALMSIYTDLSTVLTGSYNNFFHVFNRDSGNDVLLQASRDNISTPTHILDPITVSSGWSCRDWTGLFL